MKTVVLTVTSTIAVLALMAGLFLNPILGLFGLAATSIEELQKLRTSQAVLETVKSKHSEKVQGIPAKLRERLTKRMASAAVSAATVGTVAVVVAVAGMEIHDYCDEMQELHAEADVLYGSQTKFGFSQCMKKEIAGLPAALDDVKRSSVKKVSEAMSETASYTEEKWADLQEASAGAVETADGVVERLWESAREWAVPR